MGQSTALCVSAGCLFAALAHVAPGQATPPRNGSNPVPSSAPELSPDPNWEAVCAEALATPLSAAAAELALQASGPSGPAGEACDEQALYYGSGKARDVQAALRCAYRHRAHPAQAEGSFLDGAGTLALLYANGDGVPRSYPLAIRFACELVHRAGQNTDERIGRLEALRDGKRTAHTTFDLCDGQMSGVMIVYCSAQDERKGDVGRAQRIEVLEKRLPAGARAILPRLQAAEREFEEARIDGEFTGGDGTGAAGFALMDQNKLREQFVINLERFAKSSLPRTTRTDRERAGRDLSAAFERVKAMPEAGPHSISVSSALPTQEGFAKTEAVWQALFQEWMRFVPVAYPNLSHDAAATQLMRLRTHQLKAIARWS